MTTGTTHSPPTATFGTARASSAGGNWDGWGDGWENGGWGDGGGWEHRRGGCTAVPPALGAGGGGCTAAAPAQGGGGAAIAPTQGDGGGGLRLAALENLLAAFRRTVMLRCLGVLAEASL